MRTGLRMWPHPADAPQTEGPPDSPSRHPKPIRSTHLRLAAAGFRSGAGEDSRCERALPGTRTCSPHPCPGCEQRWRLEDRSSLVCKRQGRGRRLPGRPSSPLPEGGARPGPLLEG